MICMATLCMSCNTNTCIVAMLSCLGLATILSPEVYIALIFM